MVSWIITDIYHGSQPQIYRLGLPLVRERAPACSLASLAINALEGFKGERAYAENAKKNGLRP